MIDVVIIGAGAAGLFCASKASQFGLKTLLLEHNNKPAKKRLFLGKPIKLFFNKENWLNDISKKEWQENENENIELIQFELIKNRHTYSFELNKFQNIKKTTKESDMKILLNNKNGEMSFVKNYYTYEGKIFFSTVVKGICK